MSRPHRLKVRQHDIYELKLKKNVSHIKRAVAKIFVK